MKRVRVADCGQPEKTCLTLLPQPLERRHYILEDLPNTKRVPATGLGDRVVQMENVDMIAAQSRQAAVQGLCGGISDTAELLARQPHLCTDDHVGSLEVAQDAAEVLF